MKTTELKKFCKKANKLKSDLLAANDYILVKDGQLVRTDLKRYIVLNVPELDPNLNCLVDFKAFKKIIDRAKTIDIYPGNEELETKIQTEKGVYTLTQDSYTEDYPEFPAKELKKIDSLDSQEIKSVKKAVNYTAKDELRPAMESILVDTDHIVATDAHRLCFHKRPKTANQRILVDKTIANLLEDKKHDIGIDESQKWIKIFEEDYEYWFDQTQDNFPQWREVIPEFDSEGHSPIEVTVDAKELKTALEDAEPALPEASQTIVLYNNTKQSRLHLNTKDLDTGNSYHTKIEADSRGESMYIGFKQSFLLNIIKTEKYETLELKMFDPNRAVIINGEILLMPQEISDLVKEPLKEQTEEQTS